MIAVVSIITNSGKRFYLLRKIVFIEVCLIVLTLLSPTCVNADVIMWLPPAGPPKINKPGKIISLAPSITEILFHIGAGNLVVGVTRFDDWPPQVSNIKRVGGYLDIDIEAIAAIKPDIVFCEMNSGVKNAVEHLAKLNINVAIVKADDVESVIDAIAAVGKAVGMEKESLAKADDLKLRLGHVRASIAGLKPVPMIVFFNFEPLMAAGRGTFTDSIIRMAGGINLADFSGVKYPVIDREMLVKLDPDVIIDQTGHVIIDGGVVEQKPQFLNDFKNIKAVKNNRIYSLPGYYMFRPGPRVVDNVEKLAGILHPELRLHNEKQP